jgi:hypothetical protein
MEKEENRCERDRKDANTSEKKVAKNHLTIFRNERENIVRRRVQSNSLVFGR